MVHARVVVAAVGELGRTSFTAMTIITFATETAYAREVVQGRPPRVKSVATGRHSGLSKRKAGFVPLGENILRTMDAKRETKHHP